MTCLQIMSVSVPIETEATPISSFSSISFMPTMQREHHTSRATPRLWKRLGVVCQSSRSPRFVESLRQDKAACAASRQPPQVISLSSTEQTRLRLLHITFTKSIRSSTPPARHRYCESLPHLVPWELLLDHLCILCIRMSHVTPAQWGNFDVCMH